MALNHPSRWRITTPDLTNPIPPNCLATAREPRRWIAPYSIKHESLIIRGEQLPSDARFLHLEPISPGKGPQLEQATAGDELTLEARVYNYSLTRMPSDSRVHVRFYFMPWDVDKDLPKGDSVSIGEEQLSPIPPFSNDPEAPQNWVHARTTFSTSKFEETRKRRSVYRVLGGGLDANTGWQAGAGDARSRPYQVFQVLSSP